MDDEMERKNEDNGDGIDFSEVKKFAKAAGVDVSGMRKDDAILIVLNGIVAHYENAKEELNQEDFEEYKKKNDDMLNWFNLNKEWEPPEEPGEEAEEQEEREPETEPEDVPEEAEPEKVQEEVVEMDTLVADEAKSVPEEEATEKGLEEAKDKKGGKGGGSGKVKPKKGKKAKAGKPGKKPEGKEKDLAKTKDRIKEAKAQAEEKKVEEKAEVNVSGESSAAYIPRFRKMLENSNTLPSKIREYIKEKGDISYGDLRKACVDKLGCKSETSGPIGASVRVLELDGLVRFEGKGSSKRIIAV